MMGEVSPETSPTQTNWVKTRQNCSFHNIVFSSSVLKIVQENIPLDRDRLHLLGSNANIIHYIILYIILQYFYLKRDKSAN